MVWIIYLLGIIDNLKILLEGSCIFCIISLVCLVIWWAASIENNKKKPIKKSFNYIKKNVYVLILIIFMNIFTPSSKTIATMYLLPKIVNNEEVQKIPGKALDMLNLKMDEYLSDTLSIRGNNVN